MAQMADNRNVEAALVAGRRRQLRSRLEDDSRLAAQPGRQRCGAAFLQYHKFGGQLQRALGHTVAMDVAVQIRAGQHQREPTLRMRGVKGCDRRGRAPGVQCNQRIAGLAVPLLQHLNATQRSKKSRPARRRVPVARI